MINTNNWLEWPFETILDEYFCRIMCQNIVAHLFHRGELRAGSLNLPRKMAYIYQEPLLKRHHLLPNKMAQISEIDKDNAKVLAARWI